ncbi:ricin-type beta-trefoil lectin domain protein [Dactylosporangium sp. NPDC050588]|uniref:ricin-type beta-trefoil lectin domain protein n=1 Tax=Dactylosporangium sp. NPDC050588 TaxID=3157211 RepID=UPI0033E3E2FF
MRRQRQRRALLRRWHRRRFYRRPGKCLDNNQGVGANGNPIQSWDCTGGPNSQIWAVIGDGTIRVGGMCLDVIGYGTTNGSKLHLSPAT